MKTIKAAVLVAFLIPLQSFAWGPVGHRAVGLIAHERLTPAAKAEVAKLLGGADLGDVANWADEIKSGTKYQQTTWYHFEKIPDNVTYIDNLASMPRSQREKGGLVAALLLSEEILRNPKAKTFDKAVALKFLVHFIGDLHQPLHSGRPDDKGGGTLPVDWFGQRTSLHGVWDSRMISTAHADLFSTPAGVADGGRIYANWLKTDQVGKSAGLGSDLDAWMKESIALRDAAYDPAYQTDQVHYQNKNIKVIDERVYVAGLRLAALLNDLFAGTPLPADETLKKNVETVAGKLDSMVNYKP